MDNLRIQYFEGPDGSGKTTRISEIKSGFSMIVHNGLYPTTHHSFSAYSKQIAMLEEDDLLTCIFDRSIFSSLIYARICRNETIPNGEVEYLVDRMNAIGVLLTICLPPFEIAFNNWSSRLADEYVKDPIQYGKIYDAYVDLIDSSGMDTVVYDYTGVNPHARD